MPDPFDLFDDPQANVFQNPNAPPEQGQGGGIPQAAPLDTSASYQGSAKSGLEIIELLRRLGLDQVLRSQGPARDALVQMLQEMGLSPQQLSLLEDYQALPGQLGNAYQYGLTGPQSEIQQNLVGPGTDWVRNQLNYRGETPQNQVGFNQGMQIAGGRTVPQSASQDALLEMLGLRGRNAQLSVLGDRSTQFLANNGMTPSLDDMMGLGLESVRAGGRTPQMDQLGGLFQGAFGQALSSGQDLVQRGLTTGGFSPEIRALLDAAMAGIRSGGSNPALDEMTSEALEIIRAGGQGGALIPMGQAQSMARDQAITAARGQQEAVVRRALAMGGGPGSRTSGSQLRPLAEFADQSAQAEAAAIREATQTQQGLQLQQLLGAFGAGNQAQATAANRLNTFGQIGTGSVDAAARNLAALLQGGVGLQGQAGAFAQALLGLEEQAGRNVSTGFQGAGTAGQLANTRLSIGSQLGTTIEDLVRQNFGLSTGGLRDLTQGQNAGLAAAGQFSGQQVQGLQDLMSLFQGLTNTGAGMATSAGAQGVQRGADVNQILRDLLEGRGRTAQEGQTNRGRAAEGLNQQGSGWLNFASGTTDATANIIRTLMQLQAEPGIWTKLLAGMAQGAAGGAASSAGDIVGRILRDIRVEGGGSGGGGSGGDVAWGPNGPQNPWDPDFDTGGWGSPVIWDFNGQGRSWLDDNAWRDYRGGSFGEWL